MLMKTSTKKINSNIMHANTVKTSGKRNVCYRNTKNIIIEGYNCECIQCDFSFKTDNIEKHTIRNHYQ